MQLRFAGLVAAPWLALGLAWSVAVSRAAAQGGDPLPSWNDTAAKSAVLAYVHKVTQPGASFVPVPERIAVFDNDGTLWPENPMPFQAAYAFDEIKRRASSEPELAADPMVQAVQAREYQYDVNPKSSGTLDQALKDAPARGWTVVDMKADWKTVFGPAS